MLAAAANNRGDGLFETYNVNGKLVSLVGSNYRGDGLINAANKYGVWVSAVGAATNGNGLLETFKADGSLLKSFP